MFSKAKVSYLNFHLILSFQNEKHVGAGSRATQELPLPPSSESHTKNTEGGQSVWGMMSQFSLRLTVFEITNHR